MNHGAQTPNRIGHSYLKIELYVTWVLLRVCQYFSHIKSVNPDNILSCVDNTAVSFCRQEKCFTQSAQGYRISKRHLSRLNLPGLCIQLYSAM